MSNRLLFYLFRQHQMAHLQSATTMYISPWEQSTFDYHLHFNHEFKCRFISGRPLFIKLSQTIWIIDLSIKKVLFSSYWSNIYWMTVFNGQRAKNKHTWNGFDNDVLCHKSFIFEYAKKKRNGKEKEIRKFSNQIHRNWRKSQIIHFQFYSKRCDLNFDYISVFSYFRCFTFSMNCAANLHLNLLLFVSLLKTENFFSFNAHHFMFGFISCKFLETVPNGKIKVVQNPTYDLKNDIAYRKISAPARTHKHTQKIS